MNFANPSTCQDSLVQYHAQVRDALRQRGEPDTLDPHEVSVVNLAWRDAMRYDRAVLFIRIDRHLSGAGLPPTTNRGVSNGTGF